MRYHSGSTALERSVTLTGVDGDSGREEIGGGGIIIFYGILTIAQLKSFISCSIRGKGVHLNTESLLEDKNCNDTTMTYTSCTNGLE